MTEELGRRMFSQNVVLRGHLAERSWREFLVRAIKALDMSPAGDPAIWNYPTADGKGGVGATICQPLTESFVVLDYWDDHKGAYLHISSCKRFDVTALVEPAREFKIAVDFMGRAEMLRLDGKPSFLARRSVVKDTPEKFHWETAEKARRDGYVEFNVGPLDEAMHTGAPSDPRFDPIKG